MATLIMVLGESGTGKTTSLRNLPKEQTVLIQSLVKRLPFKNDWEPLSKETPDGQIVKTDQADYIIKAIFRAAEIGRKIIVVDDFQYVMANEFMRRANEKGYDKFTQIGLNAWNIIKTAERLPDDINVYFLTHIDHDETGREKAKTIGKMLDDKICLEGMFPIVFKTVVKDGQYLFSTQNNGSDTVKTPMGMFDQAVIENDLNHVNETIKQYYGD